VQLVAHRVHNPSALFEVAEAIPELAVETELPEVLTERNEAGD